MSEKRSVRCALIPFLSFSCYSQSPTNDGWNGFDNHFDDAPNSHQTTSTKVTRTTTSKTETNDFTSLDVKASKGKSSHGKTKNVEDDAWNILND